MEPGEPATAELTGTPEAPVLSLGIPQGQPGKDGPANTLLIGTVETLPADQPATASITGESPAQKLNLGIPQGKQGATGNPGAPGKDGQNGQDGQTPIIAVGTVTTLDPGQDATAEINGETPNLTLNLGIPEGQPGKDGVQIEDNAITPTTAWSSQQIIDTLCPSFTVSGNPVTCQPVKNYPLGAKVSFSPRQEGEGDPSPENVRPISGWDSLHVTRCGNNYIDFDNLNIVNGSYDQSTGAFTEGGLIEATEKLLAIPSSKAINLNSSGANARVFFWGNNGEYLGTVLLPNGVAVDFPSTVAFIAFQSAGTGFSEGQKLYAYTGNFYEPYQGATYDIALPETVYGGTVDCVTGKGKKTWETILIDEDFIANNIFSEYGSDQGKPGFSIVRALNGTYNRTNGFCSHAEVALNSNPTPDAKSFIWLGVNNNFIYWVDAFAAFGVSSLNDAKNALIAQATAGTPVTIAYQLATPEPFEVTPHPIPALPGVNTLYTDGDSLEVSGRRDLLSTLEDLQHTLTAVTNIISEGGLT